MGKLVFLFKNLKLREKLILSYIIANISFIGIIGFFSIRYMSDAALDKAYGNYKANFKELCINLSNKLNSYFELSDEIISDRKLVLSLNDNYTSVTNYFTAYFDYISIMLDKPALTFPHECKIKLYTENNSVIVDNSNVFKIDSSVRNQPWYEAVMNGHGSNVVYGPVVNANNSYSFYIGRTLDEDSNKSRLLMVIEIPEKQISDIFFNQGLDNQAFLMTKGGLILSSVQKEFIGKNYYEIFGSSTESLKDSRFGYIRNKQMIFNENLSRNKYLTDLKAAYIVDMQPVLSEITNNIKISLLVFAGSICFSMLLLIVFINKITSRLRVLVKNMAHVQNECFDISLDVSHNDEIGELYRAFNNMVSRINHLITEVYTSQMKVQQLGYKKKEAELQALQSQMDPHFLVNFMEAIRIRLLKNGVTDVADILLNFTKLLRKSIDWVTDKITLKQELELVESYLNLQIFRHKEKIKYEIHVDKGLENIIIPKFLIQPIVENAIFHGLEQKIGNGEILINITQLDTDVVMITVYDNGVGIPEDKLSMLTAQLSLDEVSTYSTNVGIMNVSQRIQLYYGKPYGIKVNSSVGNGTCVEITIPLKPIIGNEL